MVAIVDEIKTKKRINSKAKGARGEISFRDFMRAEGFVKAHRGQQYCGAKGDSDVPVPELPNIHFEVKFSERFNAYDALWQAMRDCGYKTPVVAYRNNGGEWIILMRGIDWTNLVKDAGYVKTVFCPDCKSTEIQKDGKDIKGQQRYECLNSVCERVIFTVC